MGGIVTAGMATGAGSEERTRMLELLGGPNWTLSDEWSARKPVTSTLVVGAIDTRKQESVRDMMSWLKKERDIHIQDHRVHFFDDRIINILPFKGTGFNARQISCPSRDGEIGFCGGTLAEATDDIGVHDCSKYAVGG